MSQAGESAEEIVKIVLDGAEVAVKIVGDRGYEISKDFIESLIKEMRNEQNTKGRQTLKGIMKSGEPVKTFLITKDKLKRFVSLAKKFGVPYHVVKSKLDKSDAVNIIVKASDSATIDHIFNRYLLAQDNKAAIKNSFDEKPVPEVEPREKGDVDKFVEELFSDSEQKKESYANTNPTMARMEKSRPSERYSKEYRSSDKVRVSVRDELKRCRVVADQRNSVETTTPVRVPVTKRKEGR